MKLIQILIAAVSLTVSAVSAAEPVLRHVVCLKFKADAKPEAIARVEKDFQALKSQIPQISQLEWGTNNSPEKLNKGYTHCFTLTFKTEADRDAYLPHPDHKKFAGSLKDVLEDALVIDYWTK